jgi:hypothetical protein
MGGSGGGGSYFSGTTSPEELRRQVSELEDRTRSQEFDAKIAATIGEVLADANPRDPNALERHMKTIRQAVNQDIDGVVDMRFGGSIAKHTYVDGLSDADSLVVLNRSELENASPEAVKHYFAGRLRERLPNTEVSEGQLAVTVKFTDTEVQLIPALRSGSGVRIPSADAGGWSETIRPDAFARKLATVNQSLSGKLVPTIKLAKILVAKLPEKQRLSGYHIESLAIKVLDGYAGTTTTKAMLKHFFAEAPNHIRQPIRDSTGQSLHVDAYLGPADSIGRRVASRAIARIGQSMTNADTAQSKQQWDDLFA